MAGVHGGHPRIEVIVGAQPLPGPRRICARGVGVNAPSNSPAPIWAEAFATMGDGLVVLDHAGRILDVSEAFVRQSGHDKAELIGRPLWQFEVDGAEPQLLQRLGAVTDHGPQLFEARQLNKGGALWHVEYAVSRSDEDGGRFFVFCRDVSRRKRSEELLAARERIARVALEGTLDDVIQATLDTAEALTGSNIGFLHFVEPDQRELTLQCWSTNTLQNMCTAAGKGSHYPLDRAGVWVDCVGTKAPVIHDDYASLPHKKGLPEGHAPIVRELVVPVLRGENVLAILGVGNKASSYTDSDVDLVSTLASLCIDLVARLRAEERGAEDRLELERRTQQLHKLESLQTVAAGVAHDFNNIFTAALGHLELAESDLEPGSPIRGDLHDARTAIARAARLSRQMLAASGAARLATHTTTLPEVLAAQYEALAATLPQGLSLEFAHGEVEPIAADEAQLQRVIEQLVTNAREAMGERRGTILVTSGVVNLGDGYLDASLVGEPLPHGRYATLAVSDTGHGMDAATLSRVFDPFFTTRFTGRGMGMSEALGIVRAHKGAVSIVSSPGQGTTVRLFLPLAKRAQSTENKHISEPAGPLVLLVDDEGSITSIGRRVLERAGFSTLIASSGEEALQAFRENEKDIRLIVLDVSMPDMSGIAVLEQIRAVAPAMPVIMSSGYTERNIVDDLHGLTTQGFLAKPYDARALIDATRRALGRPG